MTMPEAQTPVSPQDLDPKPQGKRREGLIYPLGSSDVPALDEDDAVEMMKDAASGAYI